MVMSAVSAFHTYLRFSQEQRSVAMVIGITKINNSWGTKESYPIVTLSGPNKSTLERPVFSNFHQSELDQFGTGSLIAVRYNPEKPLEVKVDSLASNVMTWLFTWVTVLLGISSLVLFAIHSIFLSFMRFSAKRIRVAKIKRLRESSLKLEEEPFI